MGSGAGKNRDRKRVALPPSNSASTATSEARSPRGLPLVPVARLNFRWRRLLPLLHLLLLELLLVVQNFRLRMYQRRVVDVGVALPGLSLQRPSLSHVRLALQLVLVAANRTLVLHLNYLGGRGGGREEVRSTWSKGRGSRAGFLRH